MGFCCIRGDLGVGPAEGAPRGELRQAKIENLDVSAGGQEQVGRLDIAVDYALDMSCAQNERPSCCPMS